MKKLNLLLARNFSLYWLMIRLRFTVLLIVTIGMLVLYNMRGLLITDIFYGVIQRAGSFDVPIFWLFLVLSPMLIVGDAPRVLVRRDYVLVNYISLPLYLNSILGIISVTVGIIWGVWFMFSSGWLAWKFSLLLLLILITLTCCFSIIQIFLQPILTELLFLLLLVMTIAINNFPLLSQLMFIRYTGNLTGTTFIEIFILVIGIICLERQIYHLDFSYSN